MGEFVSYMMQVALVMTLLYLAYKWLMATATFHRLNRFVLMAIYAVSWLLPVAMPLFATSASEGGEVSVGLPISVMLVEDTAVAGAPFDWWRALVWVYIAGSRSIHACRYSAHGLGDMFRTALQEEGIHRGGDRQGTGTLQLGTLHCGAAMRPRQHSPHGHGT